MKNLISQIRRGVTLALLLMAILMPATRGAAIAYAADVAEDYANYEAVQTLETETTAKTSMADEGVKDPSASNSANSTTTKGGADIYATITIEYQYAATKEYLCETEVRRVPIGDSCVLVNPVIRGFVPQQASFRLDDVTGDMHLVAKYDTQEEAAEKLAKQEKREAIKRNVVLLLPFWFLGLILFVIIKQRKETLEAKDTTEKREDWMD